MAENHDTVDRELHPVDDSVACVAGWVLPIPQMSQRPYVAKPSTSPVNIACLAWPARRVSLLRIQLFGGVMPCTIAEAAESNASLASIFLAKAFALLYDIDDPGLNR